MPTIASADYLRPKSWDEFEDICWDYFRRDWGDPNAVRHGRSGQAQQGVDIYGVRNTTGLTVGAQCKLHLPPAVLAWHEVLAEVQKAEEFSRRSSSTPRSSA